MAEWNDLQGDAYIYVYFYDPHSPWQRLSSEHMKDYFDSTFLKAPTLT